MVESTAPNKTLSDLIELSKNKKSEIVIWLAYNILVGTLSLWISGLLFLIGTPSFDCLADIKKGALLIFITTLIGTSMGFFAEVTRRHFWTSRRFLFIGLLLALIISIFLYPVVAIESFKNVIKVNDSAVVTLSLILFVIATFLCLILYLMRLSFEEEEGFSLPEEEEQTIQQLTKDAMGKTEVEGVKL